MRVGQVFLGVSRSGAIALIEIALPHGHPNSHLNFDSTSAIAASICKGQFLNPLKG
jgi:hypothetical protein